MMNLEAIRDVEMFAGLNEEDLAAVMQVSQPVDYPAGAVILREGAAGGMLHLIVEGAVEVRKKISGGEKPIASLGAGTVFGEMSLMDGFPYSASVVATTETKTLTLFRNDFMSMADANPALAFKISVNLLNTLAQKLRKTNENLVTLALLRSGQS